MDINGRWKRKGPFKKSFGRNRTNPREPHRPSIPYPVDGCTVNVPSRKQRVVVASYGIPIRPSWRLNKALVCSVSLVKWFPVENLPLHLRVQHHHLYDSCCFRWCCIPSSRMNSKVMVSICGWFFCWWAIGGESTTKNKHHRQQQQPSKVCNATRKNKKTFGIFTAKTNSL